MSPPTPNQTYLAKGMEFRLAAAVAVVLADLGYNVASAGPAYQEHPGAACFYPTGWRRASQHFDVRPSGSRKASTVEIRFSSARWDTENSDLEYGSMTLDHKVLENDEGKTKIVKNNTTGELHVSYEEEVDLTNSFSSSITKGVTLDMTTDASVDASVTVKGEYAGVGAEATVAAHFGVSESKSTSEEIGKEKAVEGTHAESLAIEFDAEPWTFYLVQITYENVQTRQPFDINGIMDFDIEVRPQNRYWQGTGNSRHRPRGNVKVRGIAGLLQFVYGYDTDYPTMQGYWDRAPDQVKSAIAWIATPENRRIQASGTSQASLDSNEDFEVKELGAAIPTALAHLPVVSATDVGR